MVIEPGRLRSQGGSLESRSAFRDGSSALGAERLCFVPEVVDVDAAMPEPP